MARLSRLSLPGVAHLVEQRGHNGTAIVLAPQDADELLQILREEALTNGVVLHGYAVSESRMAVLATPSSTDGLSRMMQGLGRRWAAVFNRRNGRSGSLWDGRFRSALVGPGEHLLTAMRWLDGQATPREEAQTDKSEAPDAGLAAPLGSEASCRSSAAHRCGGKRDAALVDPPEYWQLGNTPFERDLRYRDLLGTGIPAADATALQRALQGGWAYASSAFIAQSSQSTGRPLAPRKRGRPRRDARTQREPLA